MPQKISLKYENVKNVRIFFEKICCLSNVRLKDWPRWGQLVNSNVSFKFRDENTHNNIACESLPSLQSFSLQPAEWSGIGCLGSHGRTNCCESDPKGISRHCADNAVGSIIHPEGCLKCLFLAGAFQLSSDLTRKCFLKHSWGRVTYLVLATILQMGLFSQLDWQSSQLCFHESFSQKKAILSK